jgi:hypothetical protein
VQDGTHTVEKGETGLFPEKCKIESEMTWEKKDASSRGSCWLARLDSALDLFYGAMFYGAIERVVAHSEAVCK